MTVAETAPPPSDREPSWELLERTLSAIWALTARHIREGLEVRRTPLALRNYAESGHEFLSPSAVDPYSNPTALLAEFADLAQDGWLEEVADGLYRLSDVAVRNVREAMNAADERLEELELLPRAAMDELASLLNRLAEARTTGTKASIRPFHDTRSPIARIRGSVMALSRQRDAAHRAAWEPLGVSGETWNAFTLIWHGEARNAAEVAGLQSWRGYATPDYEAAIRDLVERGWLESDQTSGRYRPTDAGEALRNEAEARTDREFYRPWSALSDTERTVLASRLSTLTERLREVRRAERETSRQSTSST